MVPKANDVSEHISNIKHRYLLMSMKDQFQGSPGIPKSAQVPEIK